MSIRTNDGSFWIVTGLLLVWVYGLVLGFVKGNPSAWVLQNFGGMALYVIAYFLIQTDREKILAVRAVHFSAIYTAILTLVLKYFLLNNRQLAENLEFIFGSFAISYPNTGYQPRIIMKGHLSFFIIIVFCSIFIIRSNKNILAIKAIYKNKLPLIYKNFFITLFVFLIIAYEIFFINMSKGFIISTIIIILIVVIATNMSIKKSVLTLKIPGIIIFIIFISIITYIFRDIMYIFSENSSGNMKRYLQIQVFLDNITFWGHGLGAEVQGAADLRGGRRFADNESAKLYAVELIYLNIFHKFGIFALWIIYSYLYVFVRAFRKITSAQSDIERAFGLSALAMVGFTIIALGNPILFGPAAIILHIIALRLLARV
jgi:hypothetical protein